MSAEKSQYVRRLLEAKSVAVIGASGNPVKPGGRPLHYLLKEGFEGQVVPVNPKYDRLMGIRCYPDIRSVEGGVDLAIMAVGAERLEEELMKCVEKGVKSYVVFSSGFSELNEAGRHLQEKIRTICEEHQLAMLGPNSLGMLNCHTGLIASFTTSLETRGIVAGELGFVSQSGALGSYLLDMLQKDGIGISKWVTTGNEAVLHTTDFAEYLVEDDHTKVIAMYLEDVKDGHRFKQVALKAADQGKPIVVIKAGRSEAGARAAASHTGSMAGEDSKYQTVFDQLGMIRVRSLSELVRTSKWLLYQGVSPAKNIGIVSVSGGAGVLLADEAAQAGLQVPSFDDNTAKRLRDVLPPIATVQNPMDVTGQILADPSTFRKTLTILKNDPRIDTLIIFIGLMKSIGDDFVSALQDVKVQERKKVAVVWVGATEETVRKLENDNIPVFADIPDAIEAISLSNQGFEKREAIVKDRVFRNHCESAMPAGEKRRDARNASLEGLTEYRTKEWLKPYGLPCPKEMLVNNAEEALAGMERGLVNFPVALKLQSAKMLHKSDHGGLLLNIRSKEELTEGVEQLLRLGEQMQIPVEGVLVQNMVKFDQELIVGIQDDPVWGPILTVGRGGIFVEVLKDFVSMALPVSSSYMIDKLEQLKSSNMFRGYRGKKEVDLQRLAEVIGAVCQCYLEHRKEFAEMEINPLALNTDSGEIWALDGLAMARRRETD